MYGGYGIHYQLSATYDLSAKSCSILWFLPLVMNKLSFVIQKLTVIFNSILWCSVYFSNSLGKANFSTLCDNLCIFAIWVQATQLDLVSSTSSMQFLSSATHNVCITSQCYENDCGHFHCFIVTVFTQQYNSENMIEKYILHFCHQTHQTQYWVHCS